MKKIVSICFLYVFILACNPYSFDDTQGNMIAVQFPIESETIVELYDINNPPFENLIYVKIEDSRIQKDAVYQFLFKDLSSNSYMHASSFTVFDADLNPVSVNSFEISQNSIEFYTYESFNNTVDCIIWMFLP